MSIHGEPETDEAEREQDEKRRALIASDVLGVLLRGGELRVSLHKLLTDDEDGIYRAYYLAEGAERQHPLFMCTLTETFSRAGAETDVREWLAAAAAVEPNALGIIAFDLRSAPALLLAS